MLTFDILEHPADIGFRAFGDSLPELFANSALAMLSIASDVEQAEPSLDYSLTAAGGGYESLMVNWLNEVLYWFDGKRIALRDIRITQLSPEGLAASGRGEPRDPVRHRAKLIVKAATWHQLKVAQTEGRWFAEVYLDI
ncbi:MAG: archease [Bryobacteraceae bacterium]